MTSRWHRYSPVGPFAARGPLATVVEPAQFFNTNGMRVAADGRVWITSTLGAEVMALSLTDRRPKAVVPFTAGLGGPDDIAFDSAGNAYFTEPHHDRVMRRTPQGVIDEWATGLPSANGITMGPGDRLFVDECRPGGRLLELAVAVPQQVRVIVEGLGMPNALEQGADGRVYLPEVSDNCVTAVDPASGAREVVVRDVLKPSSVKFLPDGRLLVTSAGTGEVFAIDLASGTRTVLVTGAVGLDNAAYDSTGLLYVSNFVCSQLLAREPDGTIHEVCAPSLVEPTSITGDGNAGFVVANRTSIATVSAAGEVQRPFQLPVELAFNVSHVARVDRDLYARAFDGRVVVSRGGGALTPVADGVRCLASAPGGVVAAWDDHIGLLHDDASRVAARVGPVVGIATDGTRFFVAEASSGSLLAVEHDGTVRDYGTFGAPRGLALDATHVYVADEGGRAVVAVDRASGDRQVVAGGMPFGSPRPDAPIHLGPPGLCVDGDTLVVTCPGDASIRRVPLR